MRFLTVIALFLVCSVYGQIDPRYQKSLFTTNTFDPDILGGSLIYFDYPSGKFVGTPVAYTNAITFDSTLGFLGIFHTNTTGEVMLVLQEGGTAGPSIQAYSDRLVVANTNLSFDAVGPFGIQWRVDGSNVLQSAAGGVSISGKTNVVADSGSVLTYNGVDIWTAGLSSFNYGYYGLAVPSMTLTNVQLANLPAGNNDVYTCPTGKRMIVQTIYGGTTNNANAVYVEFKTNSNYYRIGTTSTVNTNAPYANSPNTLILEEGESFSINTSKQGFNIKAFFALFSNTNRLYSPRLLSLSAGNDTLYTVPTGYQAVPVIKNSFNFNTTLLVLGNASGGARLYDLHIVPSGGSADDSNIFFQSLSVADASTSTGGGFLPILVSGDSVVLKSNAATATQVAWLTVAEIPFP